MNELEKKMQAYAQAFADGFPMIPLGWGRSEAEIIEIIDRCLKENKDVYELGYIESNPDIDY